jgi:hypothetical protein
MLPRYFLTGAPSLGMGPSGQAMMSNTVGRSWLHDLS